jgi:hypothetical protein
VLIAADQSKALALLSTIPARRILVDVNGDTLSLIDALRCGEGSPDVPIPIRR